MKGVQTIGVLHVFATYEESDLHLSLNRYHSWTDTEETLGQPAAYFMDTELG